MAGQGGRLSCRPENGETNLSAERACVDHDQGDPEKGDGYEAIQ